MADREPKNNLFQFRKGDKKRHHSLHSSDNDADWYMQSHSGQVSPDLSEREALAARADRMCAWQDARTKAVLERVGRSFQPERPPSPRPSVLRRMQNAVLAPMRNLVQKKWFHPAEPVQPGTSSGEAHTPAPPPTGSMKDNQRKRSVRTAAGRRTSKTQNVHRSPERGDEDDFWSVMEDEATHTHLRQEAWKVAELIARDGRPSTARSTGSLRSLDRVDTETPAELRGYLQVRSPAEVSRSQPAHTPTPPAAAPTARRKLSRPGRFLRLPKAAGGADKQAASGPRVQVEDQDQDQDQDQVQQVQVRLQPLANPERSLELSFKLLSSDDWEKKIDGLTSVRALAQHHSATLEAKLHEVCQAVVEEVKNLRSAVSRVAMATLGDLFVHLQRAMDCEAEETARILLLKVGQSNAFIQQQANLTLDALVHNCSPGRVMIALLNGGLSHRSAAVRGSAAQHLHQLADILGAARVLTGRKNFTERFLVAVSKMSLDSAAEVRHHGRNILQKLALHSSFPKLWAKTVPQKDRASLDTVIRKLTVR